MNIHKGAHSDEQSAASLAAAELDAFLNDHPQVRYVDCIFSDICGVVRGKRVAAAELEKLFRSGLAVPFSIYFLDARGDMTVPVAGAANDAAEGTAWPVPGTLTRVNWSQRPHGQVLMSLIDRDGSPFFGEPRNVLKRVEKRFEELDLTPVVGAELDFGLIDRERHKVSGMPQAPSSKGTEGGASDSVEGDPDEAVLKTIEMACAGQAIEARVVAATNEPGRLTLHLAEAPALKAGDNLVLLRQLVRAVARREGLDATFMAKPYLGLKGNGLRTRLALRHASGKSVFADGSASGSELLRSAIGGLQAMMAETMALYAPNVNAFRRLAGHASVPRNKRWSYDNPSTCLQAAADKGEIEHRIASADANPYLTLAAALAAVHHGILHRLEPSAAFQGDAMGFADETLPASFDAALLALENGALAREYLAPPYVDLYCATKRTELERFRNIIPAHEYDWYL